MTTTTAASIPFVPRMKLRPPRLSEDLLRRPRLIEKLDRPQSLSLVIAPAGYGKTTLVSTWLAQCGAPYAWLALEREDDTLLAFLAGFGAALGRLAPTLGDELLQRLHKHAWMRGFWYGGNRLFFNAIFYGSAIKAIVADDGGAAQ